MILPALNIPSEHQSGLARLHNLEEGVASSLLTAIKAAAETSRKDSVSVEELEPIHGLNQSDAEEILDTLTSLYRVRASADVTVSEFVTDVCESMRYGVRKDLRLSEAELPKFKERITKFLSLDILNRLTKGVILRYDHEHPFCTARILTDARPVFGIDPQEPPESIVIFHMLKIEYHEGRSIREIYFALDESDLTKLENLIDRAKKKAASLLKALTASNMKIVSPD